MKKLFAYAAVSVFALSVFASCTKCYDCSISIFGVTSTQEVCGTKSEIQEVEDAGWDCN